MLSIYFGDMDESMYGPDFLNIIMILPCLYIQVT